MPRLRLGAMSWNTAALKHQDAAKYLPIIGWWVASVIRDYGMADRAQAPIDSQALHD